MDNVQRIVKGYLNSAEGYFHLKRIIQDQVKQQRDAFGPMSDRSERWDYTDKRDINKQDIKNLIKAAVIGIDKDLYNLIPDVAIKASLDYTIHSFDKSRFQSKIDSPIYNILYNIIKSNLERK